MDKETQELVKSEVARFSGSQCITVSPGLYHSHEKHTSTHHHNSNIYITETLRLQTP